MISASACQHWQPDRQLIAAQRSRSYTTRRDTIQDSAAFKLMSDGTPGPNGVNDTVLPQWVLDAPSAVYQAYMNTACALTHIECRT